MDEEVISYPTVSTQITDGAASISGNFTLESATDLANKINGGALPFKLEIENFRSISATLGMGAKDAMVLAGSIAFALVAIFVIVFLPVAWRSGGNCVIRPADRQHYGNHRIFRYDPQLYADFARYSGYHPFVRRWC